MGWPEENPGLGGLSFDEHDLMQGQTSTHAKSLLETSLKYGKTANFFVPQGELVGRGPYELPIPSMASDWTDLTSAIAYGKFQVKKLASGAETDAGNSDDYR